MSEANLVCTADERGLVFPTGLSYDNSSTTVSAPGMVKLANRARTSFRPTVLSIQSPSRSLSLQLEPKSDKKLLRSFKVSHDDVYMVDSFDLHGFSLP